MRLGATLLGIALTCTALPARAEGWAVGVGTDFPVRLGARFDYEAPFRLRLTSLGFLPGPYVDAMNGVLVGVGAYARATADLIQQTLQSSLVWCTHVGYRPFPKLGRRVHE